MISAGLETTILEHSPFGQVTFKPHLPRQFFTRLVSSASTQKTFSPPPPPPLPYMIHVTVTRQKPFLYVFEPGICKHLFGDFKIINIEIGLVWQCRLESYAYFELYILDVIIVLAKPGEWSVICTCSTVFTLAWASRQALISNPVSGNTFEHYAVVQDW